MPFLLLLTKIAMPVRHGSLLATSMKRRFHAPLLSESWCVNVSFLHSPLTSPRSADVAANSMVSSSESCTLWSQVTIISKPVHSSVNRPRQHAWLSASRSAMHYCIRFETMLFQLLLLTIPQDPDARTGLFENPILLQGIKDQWFSHSTDEGVTFHLYFNPIPLPLMALVFTAVSRVLPDCLPHMC
jgi:Domain of unknown function (DUF6532)